MENLLEKLGSVTVDKGAIRFVCNGANIMRPGVIRWEGVFKSGDVVVVKEELHNKSIAVGFAIVCSSDIQNISRGIIVKNMHYVGDELWEAYKKV